MEINHLFFGKEIKDIKRVQYDANLLSDIVINVECAFDEMHVRIEPMQLFIRCPEMTVLDWQENNDNQFYKNQLEFSLICLKSLHLKQEQFNELFD